MNYKIEIEIKPVSEMRYSTVGDYFFKENGILKFEIADTGDWFYNTLVLVHEMIEEALTRKRGLPEQEILDFDKYYEMRREQGLVPENSEPGFDSNSPYLKEHTFATGVEMGMCAMAGIAWNEYDRAVMQL